MQLLTITTILGLLTLPFCVEAKLINVDVGNGGIIFEPSTVVADIGDQVQFRFYNNHSVVQSNFVDPCKPLKNGFYSGFIVSDDDGPAKDSFIVTVKTKDPIWYYCSQGGHCQAGMDGAINAPGGEDALSAYVNAARLALENITPNTDVSGGKLGPIITSLASTLAKVSLTFSSQNPTTEITVSTTSTTNVSTTSTTPATRESSTASKKGSLSSATSSTTKTVSTTPSPSKASRKHRMSHSTALAILTTVASLKTSGYGYAS